MFDKTYRQRLEADLAQWEADGVIAPAAAASIRIALPPLSPGINIAVIVAIVGGLLIAAAFLAFVAAHWTEIARLLRFAILLAGMIVAGGLGAWFAATGRTILADLCASIGAIIFGAGIALVGQMYHLGDDFAGGMLLWSIGAFAAALLTGSRGALAVGLAAACIWSCMRVYDAPDALHLQFVVAWLIAAAVAFAWNSRVAAHLVAIAVLPWWIATSLRYDFDGAQPSFVLANGAALLFGAGLAIAAAPSPRALRLGSVLAVYGAFSLAVVAFLEVTTVDDLFRLRTGTTSAQPLWAILCGIAGVDPCTRVRRHQQAPRRSPRRMCDRVRAARGSDLARRPNRRAMVRLCRAALRHAVPRRFRRDRRCASKDRCRLARHCRCHRCDHLGGEGLAAAPLGLPGSGWRYRRRVRNRAQSRAAEG